MALRSAVNLTIVKWFYHCLSGYALENPYSPSQYRLIIELITMIKFSRFFLMNSGRNSTTNTAISHKARGCAFWLGAIPFVRLLWRLLGKQWSKITSWAQTNKLHTSNGHPQVLSCLSVAYFAFFLVLFLMISQYEIFQTF